MGDKDKPAMTPRAAQALAERRAREAEALRQNLLKRKAQERARRELSPGGETKDGAGEG